MSLVPPEVLAAVERGWSVVPCSEDKHPPKGMKWKQFQITPASLEQVERWQRELNPPAWAVITGAVSGMVAIDWDGERGQELRRELGVPANVATGSGGAHTWVTHPGDGVVIRTLNSKTKRELGKRFPGMDIRGDGGLAVFAGRNGNGAYKVISEHVLAHEALPHALRCELGLLQPPSAERLLELAIEKVQAGEYRNDTGFWLALQLRDNRHSVSVAEQTLLEYVDSVADHGDHPYTADEATASVRSAYGSPPREPWGGGLVNGHLGELDPDTEPPVEEPSIEPAHRVEETPAYTLGLIPKFPIEVLPEAARAYVRHGVEAGLPAELLAGAAIAAIAAAIGGGAEIRIGGGWPERANLWLALTGERGVGKSASQGLAFDPLHAHDMLLDEDSEHEALVVGDVTLEALARELKAASSSSLAMDVDELSQVLRGMGEYKGQNSGDWARYLSMWEGKPLIYKRVGSGGRPTNGVSIRVPKPTVVIVGGLQPHLHALLGGDEDGMRPRWLPFRAIGANTNGTIVRSGVPSIWPELIRDIVDRREQERVWRLDDGALAAFEHHRGRWRTEARHEENPSCSAAMDKGDRHLGRLALVLAEGDRHDRAITAELIARAAVIVDYTTCGRHSRPPQAGSDRATTRSNGRSTPSPPGSSIAAGP